MEEDEKMGKIRKENINRKNALQLIFMMIFTCLSQIVALYKSRFTAITFGATYYMDAYNFAVNIATFIFAFVTTGITTVIVPAYVKKTDKKVINSFITIIYSVVIIIVFFICFFRYPLISILTKKGQDFTLLVASFLFIAFLIQGITSFLAVTTAYFQCINHFIIPKAVMLTANIAVTGVLLTGIIENIYSYLFLLILGALINLIFDVGIAVKLGFRYRPAFYYKEPELHRMLHVFLPTLFSSGLYKIHTLVDTTIAANLLEGQLTILSYATQIITMVNNVIIGNLTVYAYPKIVARLEKSGEKKYFWDYVLLFHGVVVLIIAGFINVGFESCSIIFLGGKFTAENTQVLYNCVCVYILGQQFNVVRDLIYRYFYANGNTKATLQNSVVISLLNIVFSLILVHFLGLMGIIIGTVLSSLISLIMITIKFSKHYGLGVNIKRVLMECSKNIVALVITIGLIQMIKRNVVFSGTYFSIFIYGILTVVIYITALLCMKSDIRHVKL